MVRNKKFTPMEKWVLSKQEREDIQKYTPTRKEAEKWGLIKKESRGYMCSFEPSIEVRAHREVIATSVQHAEKKANKKFPKKLKGKWQCER